MSPNPHLYRLYALIWYGKFEEIIRICKKYGAEKVVLFGSRAKGTQTARSDIDIAVSAVASGDIFDLAWKVMKDILIQYYAITGFVTDSPREVLKQAFQAYLITGDQWMDMLKVRNQLAHDYDGVIVKEHCQTIIHAYIDKFYEFRVVVEGLLKEEGIE